jgi:hypothetical protein
MGLALLSILFRLAILVVEPAESAKTGDIEKHLANGFAPQKAAITIIGIPVHRQCRFQDFLLELGEFRGVHKVLSKVPVDGKFA